MKDFSGLYSTKPEKMRWRFFDNYLMSECRRYTISKALCGEVTKYTAWDNTVDNPTRLGVFDNAQEAKEKCEQHRGDASDV